MVHPVYVVYVILYGRFITIFTGKPLQFLPDPAPVLHGFLLVPGKFCRDMAFCNLPERDFPPSPLHLRLGRDRTRSAHNPHVHVRHGEIRAMQCRNGLVAVSLQFEPAKSRSRSSPRVVVVRYREYPPKSSSAPCPVMMRRYPCCPAERAIKYWVRAIPVLTGSFSGIALMTSGRAVLDLFWRDGDTGQGKAERIGGMPCLPEVVGTLKPDRHALAPGKTGNKGRVHPSGERGDALVAAELDRGDDGLLKRQVRNRRFDRPFHLTVTDEGPFRAVALHDPEMVPCPAPAPGKEKFPAEPEDLTGAVIQD